MCVLSVAAVGFSAATHVRGVVHAVIRCPAGWRSSAGYAPSCWCGSVRWTVWSSRVCADAWMRTRLAEAGLMMTFGALLNGTGKVTTRLVVVLRPG